MASCLDFLFRDMEEAVVAYVVTWVHTDVYDLYCC